MASKLTIFKWFIETVYIMEEAEEIGNITWVWIFKSHFPPSLKLLSVLLAK